MDRQLAIDLDIMKRIVALLLSLALLAERASARSAVVRATMSWLLRRAGAAALALVVDPAEAEAIRAAPFKSDPCELIRLAASLRAIAMLLAQATDCLAPASSAERGFARPVRPVRPGRHPAAPGFRAGALHDTS